jgi:dTDP-glucose pyrophosphorylase
MLIDVPTVRPDDSLAMTFELLRARREGLAVVLGRGERVVGAVSDSGLRRAVLGGNALEETVAAIMSRQPLTAPATASDVELAELLRTRRLRTVALVDQRGRLAGTRSLHDLAATTASPPPTAIIMAGGRGQRLRPLTDKVPKPLLPIGDNTIVERLIGGLVSACVNDIYLALNYKAKLLVDHLGNGEKLGVEIRHLRERTALGTAGALSLLPDIPKGPIIVSNGDLVTTLDFQALLDFHWHHRGSITATAVQHRTYIPYGLLQTAEHHLLGIDEKPTRIDFVSAGIYVLEPEVLSFVPPDMAYGMPDLIAAALAEGLAVNVFPILERWFDIGSPEGYEHAMAFAASNEGRA